MQYFKVLIIAMFLLVSSQVVAQEDGLEKGTLEDDIRELLITSNAVKLGDQMLDQIFDAYESSVPDVPPEVWKKVRSEMRASEFIEFIIPIYAKHFNRKDIKGIMSFYKSPVGRKLIDSQGEIMKESMAVGMAWGQEVSKRIASDLNMKGYKVPNSL